jgi:tRNA modification GTPase
MMVASEITPGGRGAVATIAIAGDLARIDAQTLFLAANERRIVDQPIDRICFGRWGAESPEDVVLCRTSADSLELHCHGGRAAVERILQDLRQCGATVEPRDAFLTRRSSRLEAECARALLKATTRRTAAILAAQRGLWAEKLSQIESNLAAPSERVRWDEHLRMVDASLRWETFSRHLTTPWKIVLCGRPNVGKSSLINALLGYTRSIVFDQPGTTRDVITAETALDGWPVELSDTAGLRESAEEIESAGVTRARERLQTADLKLLLLDAGSPPHSDDEDLLEEHPDALIVASKWDLPRRWGPRLPSTAHPVSAVTGFGVEGLVSAIVKRLVPELPPAGTPLPVTSALERLVRQLRESVQGKVALRSREVCMEFGSPSST